MHTPPRSEQGRHGPVAIQSAEPSPAVFTRPDNAAADILHQRTPCASASEPSGPSSRPATRLGRRRPYAPANTLRILRFLAGMKGVSGQGPRASPKPKQWTGGARLRSELVHRQCASKRRIAATIATSTFQRVGLLGRTAGGSRHVEGASCAVRGLIPHSPSTSATARCAE